VKYAPKLLIIAGLLLINKAAMSDRNEYAHLFEKADEFAAVNPIDEHVLAKLKEYDIKAANLCSDEVFIRRVYLDVTGILPDGPDVRKFLRNGRKNKRAELIDLLLFQDEFAEYWSLRWSDILRVKAEYPINLWPNAVQAYHRWIYECIRDNKPYNEFAREMLTSSGSNFRVPQVNFYRAVQEKNPQAIAGAVALTFMGTRIEKWPVDKRQNMEIFFSRVAYKKTAEWKEEIVYLDPSKTEPINAVLPDGKKARIESGQDPRQVFADWLITPDNPYFAKTVVNRIWFWLMGKGIIHEADDIRDDNPPCNPELLAFLEKELIKSKYDLRHIYRLILNSRTYQSSSIPQSNHVRAERLFAYYPVRQLDAEVLVDALCKITGTKESYKSPIPEPFTYVPEEHRSINLADGSITSQFLETFGRPARDSGLLSERNNKPSDAQRLHFLNSTHIQKKIERSPRLRMFLRTSRRNKNILIDILYINVLSRRPTSEEIKTAKDYFKTEGITRRQAVNDIVWALINTKEFLFKH